MKFKIILLMLLGFLLSACQTTKIVYIRDDSNLTKGNCRIACYSYESKHSLYSVGNNIYVMGFAQVPGMRDDQRVCRPQGYEKADISASADFKSLCKIMVKNCGDNCWAGGAA